ncbi:MAG: TetR/AcrR family transcriptional regulator [Galactobacter sp.]|uniref:TetR/AcrR family transcriptional regulator n=1 Tax=Galactobacter sp. TaxID=2676125 RepID=UPI0025B7D36F|nr:TetR/AcrR family transcriptional regulator [Galactobacter sp.]
MKQLTDLEGTESLTGEDETLDGRETRWVDHRSRKRQDLVRSARKSIHLNGPGVPMDVIASDAGTSKSVVYRYFGGKDGLRSAIGADVVDGLRDAVVAAAAATSDPETSLRAMVRTYLEQAASSPNTYAFVLGGETAPAADAPSDTVLAFTRDLAQLMGERLDELAPLESSPGLAGIRAYAAIGLIRSAGESWLAGPAPRGTPEALAATITGWLLAGLTTTS